MVTIKRILLTTDFSENALLASSYAAEIAQKFDAEVIVLHCIEVGKYQHVHVMSKDDDEAMDVVRNLREWAEARIKETVDQIKKQGCTVRGTIAMLEHKRVADAILEFATEHAIDTICIGVHGQGGLETRLFGSTTEKVLRQAPCPVYAVRLPLHQDN